MNIPEQFKVVNILAPTTDASARTSTWSTLKDSIKAWIVVNVSNAAATALTVTPTQATAVAGSSAKPIPVSNIWSCLDGVASDLLVRRTSAVAYATPATATKICTIIIEIDPASLDSAGGFDCVGFATLGAAATNLLSAQLICQMRYDGAATMPSVLTD